MCIVKKLLALWGFPCLLPAGAGWMDKRCASKVAYVCFDGCVLASERAQAVFLKKTVQWF